MLKLRELALQPDFQLGPIEVSPSRRLVEGPAGTAHVEPIIMQVMLLLLDARGSVVTRNELFDQCWGAATVGDDSLNRAVLKVRRILEEIAPGQVEIETIPRTGYRLAGKVLQRLPEAQGELDAPADRLPLVSRRLLIGGGAAVVAAGGVWLLNRPQRDPRFEALMARGDEALRNGAYDDRGTIESYNQAVRIEPGDAKAWGLFAFFTSEQIQHPEAKNLARLTDETEYRARRALAIDPKEPNALVAMFRLKGQMLDWATRDRQLRDILAIDGNNIPTLRELMVLVQAAGLTRESWSWNERILDLAPLSRPHLVTRAMKLWILGRVTDADKVIDHVRGLWPDYPFAYFVRLMLFALTDRPRAALALLDSAPKMILPATDALSRVTLAALDTGTPRAVEAARIACVEAARNEPQTANMAVMILCALGLTDAAFEVTYGFLLGRGKLVSTNRTDSTVNNFNRRLTPWLFTPPVAVMRADPRFSKLCEDFGLAAYWRARGVKPDYMAG